MRLAALSRRREARLMGRPPKVNGTPAVGCASTPGNRTADRDRTEPQDVTNRGARTGNEPSRLGELAESIRHACVDNLSAATLPPEPPLPGAAVGRGRPVRVVAADSSARSPCRQLLRRRSSASRHPEGRFVLLLQHACPPLASARNVVRRQTHRMLGCRTTRHPLMATPA